MTNIHIKNMVCSRCIMVVENELKRLEIPYLNVYLGEVSINQKLSKESRELVRKELQKYGFDLLEDKRTKTIEKVKNLIIDQIQNKDDALETNYSNYLSKELGLHYSYLSNLFSSTEKITIEKFIIHQKIKKVQELLVYNELNLNEIAYKLNYSSVQALSMQFKKTTGYTPSHYKELIDKRRNPLA